jgi:phenylalanine-4-hydroxylase
MRQNYEQYTAEHREVWQRLFSRQAANLTDKVAPAYLQSLQAMNEVLNEQQIPCFEKLNELLYRRSGWHITVVPGLIPVNDFFALLAQRQFCSSTWLRQLSQLDYLEEPDMFHDIFGHVPLLWDHDYAQFMQEMGKLGVRYAGHREAVTMLERLYWFTIEFGLVGASTQQTRIYGAGIISSFGETNSIFTPDARIEGFQIEDVLYHPFEKDHLQNMYYQIRSLENLFEILPSVEKMLIEETSRSNSEAENKLLVKDSLLAMP